MLKKIISLICCLLPVGAGAVVDTLDDANWDGTLETGVISIKDSELQSALTAGNAIRINNAVAINDVKDVADGIKPLNFSKGLYVGVAVKSDSELMPQSNALFVMSNANDDKDFAIDTVRDVSVGTLLNVLDGWELTVRGVGVPGMVQGGLIVGSNEVPAVVHVEAGAMLNAYNLNSIDMFGGVRVDGGMSLSADTINAGIVNSAGTTSITTVAGDLSLGALNTLNGAGTTDIYSAGNIRVENTVQNVSGAGNMYLTAKTGVTIGGNLENSGALLDVNADGADVVVSGTVKNDGADSEIVFVAQSLTIEGEDENSDVSLFNRGNFNATIKNNTIFKKGISVDVINGKDNAFSLTTGTVDFGDNKSLLNSLNSFTLNVNKGALNATSIENSGANMLLDVEQGLSASYLSALNGKLSVNAANVMLSGGAIDSVQTAINVAGGANLDVVSSGLLNAAGAVSNRGNTTIRAQEIQLSNISNAGDGAVLNIGSTTDFVGTIKVAGNVTNDAGEFTLHAKNVRVEQQLGVINGGVTNIIGSDAGDNVPMTFGGINVNDATLNLETLANNIAVKGDMSVDNSGAVNLDSSVERVDITGNFYLDGTLDVGANIFDLYANKIEIANGWNMGNSGRTVQFVSNDIDITGNISVAEGSGLVFAGKKIITEVGEKSKLDITGLVGGDGSAGTITIYSDVATVGALNHAGLVREYGDSIVATNGDINVAGAIRFDSAVTTSAGLSLMSDSFLLKTNKGDISLNNVQVVTGKNFILDSANGLTVGVLNNSGSLVADAQIVNANGLIQNSGVFSVDAGTIKLKDVENYTGAKIDLFADSSVSVGGVTNSGLMNIAYTDQKSAVEGVTITGDILNQSGGTLNVAFDSLSAQNIIVTGGSVNLNASDVGLVSAGNVDVTGNIVQGAQTGSLNLAGINQFNAGILTTSGNFDAVAGDVLYKLSGVDISGDLSIYAGANAEYDTSGAFGAKNIINNGYVDIVATDGIKVTNQIMNNAGNMSLDSGDDYVFAHGLNVAEGQVTLSGAGAKINDALTVSGVLGQGDSSAMMNLLSDTYTINAGTFKVGGINQSGKLNITSSDIKVSGNILANDLTISASPSTNWMNVLVEGNVSGGVDFIGLEKMQITGDYVFSGTSSLMAAILPYADGVSGNTTDINYWANVNLTDGKLGQITNSPDAKPLIAVGGTFSSDLTMDGLGSAEKEYLEDSQIGIKIFDMIDQGTAIWLLHADGGVSDISTKIRNINVKFCNEDGSTCVAYFNNLDSETDGLPAYISVRDSDNDGKADSLYVVFDERFGGPAAIFPIQPIVGKLPKNKDSSYLAAGAIDSMIAGQLKANKFYNKTPLEVLPVIFQNTNMQQSMSELYNRMENYLAHYDGDILFNFSRLFEGVDGEQAVGLMSLNEHSTFRSFEDHMVDEFIWNRNRRLNKSWLDVDYGMFYQNTLSGDHTDGNRFAVSGGFDWQESATLILGLSGHVSHSASTAGESFDLGYITKKQMGYLDTRVTDTNLGFGGYFMKTLSDKARLFGNAFVDAHLFNVERNQTFSDTIDGNGTAFSLISEFGLLHDILNQYIVGNVYARVGYNFGLNISSDAENSEFMKYKQDGYFILTPGYSLTAQKRIYPTAWFQIRPYATIGVEYDVFGVKDSIEYKFAGAENYSTYDIKVDPFWANIGGGFELLSANGLQFGLDYRYQYNQEMQLHNIRFSGLYRF